LDEDFDGYGDNPNGTYPDLCPGTDRLLVVNVDENGCISRQLDSDNDGVNDEIDQCLNEPKGEDGYPDGCPLRNSNSDDGTSSGLGSSTILFAVIAGIVALVVVTVIVIRRRNDDFDYDDDDDDDEDWDDDDDEPLPFRSSRSAQSSPAPRSAPSRAGPTSGPKGGPGPSRGAPKGPQGRGPSSPPSRASPTRSRAPPSGRAPASQSFASEPESVEEDDGGAKVRKATLKVDLSIFEDWQTEDRESAADWVRSSLDDGDEERSIMMQLQETGWTAPQSRAIFNMGRSR